MSTRGLFATAGLALMVGLSLWGAMDLAARLLGLSWPV
jgi:hypothetical protein